MSFFTPVTLHDVNESADGIAVSPEFLINALGSISEPITDTDFLAGVEWQKEVLEFRIVHLHLLPLQCPWGRQKLRVPWAWLGTRWELCAVYPQWPS